MSCYYCLSEATCERCTAGKTESAYIAGLMAQPRLAARDLLERWKPDIEAMSQSIREGKLTWGCDWGKPDMPTYEVDLEEFFEKRDWKRYRSADW